MTRTSNNKNTRNRRKKIVKLAKGFVGCKSRHFKAAKEQLMQSLVDAYRDRKYKKRNSRRLWITRMNSFLRQNDSNYSNFMHSLKISQIHLNRKQLSEMSIHRPDDFLSLMNEVKVITESIKL